MAKRKQPTGSKASSAGKILQVSSIPDPHSQQSPSTAHAEPPHPVCALSETGPEQSPEVDSRKTPNLDTCLTLDGSTIPTPGTEMSHQVYVYVMLIILVHMLAYLLLVYFTICRLLNNNQQNQMWEDGSRSFRTLPQLTWISVESASALSLL